MNLETVSSPGGEVSSAAGGSSTASCSLTSLLGLSVCRSKAEAAHSFAKKLQTKLWSLGPNNTLSNGLHHPDERIVSTSWAPLTLAVEARLDLNRGVVTTVPVVNRPSIISLVQQHCAVMEKGNEGFQESPGQWVMEQMSAEAASVSSSDRESDTSSNTTTIPSDSDQYFDFGIETPLDCDSGSSSTGEETLLVINHDDGLPIQPESGCIFGSPILSGEEGEDGLLSEDRDEDPSFYESLSQSPAATAGFIQKVTQLSLNGESDLNGYEREDGVRDLSSPLPDRENTAHEHRLGHDSSRHVALRTHGARANLSQGCLEDIGNSDSCSLSHHQEGEPDVERQLAHIAAHSSSVVAIERRSEKEVPENGEIVASIAQVDVMIPLDPTDHLFDASDFVAVDSNDACSSDVQRSEHHVSLTGETDGHDLGKRDDPVDESSIDQDSTAPEDDVTTPSDVGKEDDEAVPTVVSEREAAEDEDLEGDEEDDQVYRRRIQRSTSLKTGKTPPGTPGRKKFVRFADALGLDLALVRTFLDEVPNVPPSAFSDLNGVEEPADINQHLMTVSPFSVGRSSTYIPISQSRASAAKQPFTLVASFTQPGSLPNFLDLVKTQKVCLETACLVDEMRLRGVVRVLNIDFHKSVLIRFTIDEWKTHSDQLAVYVPGSCDGLSDRFSFSLSGASSLQPGQRIIFALCYRVAGQEIWDSNQGKNYVFQCISNSSYTPSIALHQPTHLSPTHDSLLHDSFLPYM